MEADTYDSLEELTEREFGVVLHVHETLQENIRFWRRLIIDMTFFATTGMIGLTGFAVTRQDLELKTLVAISVLLILLGWSAALVSSRVIHHMNEHAWIIVRLDHVMKLFKRDAYLKNDTVYPERWLSYGSESWAEPMVRLCIWMLILMPMLLSAIIVMFAWHDPSLLVAIEAIKVRHW
jgi:hypothetical protein